jgi:nucleotide-binding universal stress UspA family protein
MFEHVLVTLDGTPRGEAVMPYAIELTRATGAQLTLLRVVEAAAADWGERGSIGRGESTTTIRSVFAEQARSYLEHIARQVRIPNAKVTVLVRQGQPARQIVAAADEIGADAIAMSTHSRRGLGRLMFGSVAEEVLHGANAPVLLVRAA